MLLFPPTTPRCGTAARPDFLFGPLPQQCYDPVEVCRRLMPNLAFIHTSHVLIPLFSKLGRMILPEFDIFHMTDESLIRNTIRSGRVTANTNRRVSMAIGSAHEGGADAV